VTTAALPRRRARTIATSPRFLQVASVVTVLTVWELVGRQAPLYASFPSAIISAFYTTAVTQNRLLPALTVTFTALFVGFAISSISGIVIGFLMGRVRVIELLLNPYVSALYSTPRIVLLPVLILALGIGFEVRVTMCVLSSIFPIIINTFSGVKTVDQELVDTGRSFAATRWQVVRTIVVPASMPFIFTGLRIGVSRALVGIIVAEMTAAVTGTGYLILVFGRFFQTDKLMGPVLLLGVLSIVLSGIVGVAQRRAMPWHARERAR
jgi:ABC-type nitrate/sulfonate/bicarbonate transport system permease component